MQMGSRHVWCRVFRLSAGYRCGHDAADPQIQNRNLEPALQWVEEKRADLAAARQSYEAFEFQLHRLQFLRILTQQGACCTTARMHQRNAGADVAVVLLLLLLWVVRELRPMLPAYTP
jgi:hypothetical protein